VMGSLIQARGWRYAWLLLGVALIGALAPLAAVVVRRSPEAAGLAPDDGVRDRHGAGARQASGEDGDALEGFTWHEAVAFPAFWVFAVGAALYGLVASGIGLFNESILAERGFGPAVYYQSLVVTAMTALAGNFLGGWLARSVRLGVLMAGALALLTLGLLALPHLASVGHVMAWAAVMGLGGGVVMVLFFSVWPRAFGRRHLGRIQGIAQAVTVLASAIGPLALAWCVAWTGSYAAMFRVLAVVIAAVAAGALAVRLPDPAAARTAASTS